MPPRRVMPVGGWILPIRAGTALWLISWGLMASACVAPVQWRGPARPPPRFAYVGPHGVPRAYGGGVCPRAGVHTHGFPPVPRSAFVEGERGFVDPRPIYAYFGPHRHPRRRCLANGRHLHLEAPEPALTLDPKVHAFVDADVDAVLSGPPTTR